MAVAYAALIPSEGYKHRLVPQVRLTWNSHSGAPILRQFLHYERTERQTDALRHGALLETR